MEIVIAILAAVVAFECVELVLVRRTRRIPVSAGTEAMIGRPVRVTSACRPTGRVRMGVESWKARCAEGAGIGEQLVVEAVDRVTLVVRRPGDAPA